MLVVGKFRVVKGLETLQQAAYPSVETAFLVFFAELLQSFFEFPDVRQVAQLVEFALQLLDELLGFVVRFLHFLFAFS